MPSLASILALAAPLMVYAAPVRRDGDPNNLLVLKFADVLEQFESTFYQQALQKFQSTDFTAAGFVDAQIPVQQFTAIQADEAAHQTVLGTTIESLGDKALDGCNFDFGNALNDVTTMAATARVVENLGVGAYLGAAHLISDPVLLTAAASILTVEARHQTILNVLNNGMSIPAAFDIPLLPNEVLAVAGAFISGCDTGIQANQALTITNTGSVGPGTSLTFSSPAINGSTDGLFCQMLVGGMPSSISLPFDQCVVPEGVEGPVGLFITSDQQPLNNNVRDRAAQTVLAGPALAFIDTQKQLLSQLVLAASSDSNSESSSQTTTISPSEATSILSSVSAASATGDASGASATDSAASASATDSAASASATDGSSVSAGNGAAGSSAGASASGSAAGASSTAPPESDTTVVDAPGGRNNFTGQSANGAITPELPADAGSSASASASDSAAGASATDSAAVSATDSAASASATDSAAASAPSSDSAVSANPSN
ncbi:ferritin-like domain-containing protein [Trametes elegans]|nr:ferritin-like domain-containing protein [Trametes elegans]